MNGYIIEKRNFEYLIIFKYLCNCQIITKLWESNIKDYVCWIKINQEIINALLLKNLLFIFCRTSIFSYYKTNKKLTYHFQK